MLSPEEMLDELQRQRLQMLNSDDVIDKAKVTLMTSMSNTSLGQMRITSAEKADDTVKEIAAALVSVLRETREDVKVINPVARSVEVDDSLLEAYEVGEGETHTGADNITYEEIMGED